MSQCLALSVVGQQDMHHSPMRAPDLREDVKADLAANAVGEVERREALTQRLHKLLAACTVCSTGMARADIECTLECGV
jgi:hypothetical protein